MHLVSYNRSAAVLLTPISFLPGTIWDWNALAMDPLLFFRLLMPSRTTSSLIRHLITSFLACLLFYLPETWLSQPLCICLLQEVALLAEDEDEDDIPTNTVQYLSILLHENIISMLQRFISFGIYGVIRQDCALKYNTRLSSLTA